MFIFTGLIFSANLRVSSFSWNPDRKKIEEEITLNLNLQRTSLFFYNGFLRYHIRRAQGGKFRGNDIFLSLFWARKFFCSWKKSFASLGHQLWFRRYTGRILSMKDFSSSIFIMKTSNICKIMRFAFQNRFSMIFFRNI